MNGPAPNDVLIAVLGVTGAGKTTFIQRATGDKSLKVSDGPDSCTTELSFSRLYIGGKWTCLIDTPGFDDSEFRDTDILRKVASWLWGTYKCDKLLTGIILLQNIALPRVYGSERTRTELFKKLLGKNAYSHVIIGTTFWNQLRDERTGYQRTKERLELPGFWQDIQKGGGMITRHDDDTESAQRIIAMLVNGGEVVLDIQGELEANHGKLSETSAGILLDEHMSNSSKRLLEELEKMNAKCTGIAEQNVALREEINELRKKYDELMTQKTKLESANFGDHNTSFAVLDSTAIQTSTTVVPAKKEDDFDWGGCILAACGTAACCLCCSVM